MRFFSMFWGREDVYARRGKNGGYFPQCANRWNDRLCPKQRKEKVLCDECENTKWISLDVKKIIDHLLGTKEDGSDVIGVYPLLPNGTGLELLMLTTISLRNMSSRIYMFPVQRFRESELHFHEL